MPQLIEYVDEIVHTAVQRLGQTKDHREARHLHTAFEIADERAVRSATLGQFVLREIASNPEFAQALPEDDAFARGLRQSASLRLTSTR